MESNCLRKGLGWHISSYTKTQTIAVGCWLLLSLQASPLGWGPRLVAWQPATPFRMALRRLEHVRTTKQTLRKRILYYCYIINTYFVCWLVYLAYQYFETCLMRRFSAFLFPNQANYTERLWWHGQQNFICGHELAFRSHESSISWPLNSISWEWNATAWPRNKQYNVCNICNIMCALIIIL